MAKADVSPLTGKPEAELNMVEVFKKMCRLLEMQRRTFLEADWNTYAKLIPQQQYTHLMMVRQSLPCNMSRIVKLTGLTSAGASIFVDKMVKLHVFVRLDDPDDRRNVVIDLTPEAAEKVMDHENRLSRYIFGFFNDCTEEELTVLEKASRIVCRKLDV